MTRATKLGAFKVTPQPLSDVGERIERALLRAEVRQEAKGLNPAGIKDLYQKTTDPNVRKALTELPRIDPNNNGFADIGSYVDPETVEEVLFQDGRRECPELVERLDDLRVVRSIFTVMKGTFKNEVETLCGKLDEEPAIVVH